MHKIKKTIYLIIGLYGLLLNAQNNDLTPLSVLKKAADKIKSETYFTYNLRYNVYNNQKSTVIDETFSGFLIKKNEKSYYKIKDTEFIGFKDYSVKINNSEKALMITKGQNNESPIDFEKYLKGFKYRFIGSDKNYWICELQPEKISQIMFQKIEVYIDKKDFSIHKQVVYYLNKTEETTKATKPKLEIIFSNRNSNESTDNSLLEEKNYFIRTGKEIKVVNKYKDYKLYKV